MVPIVKQQVVKHWWRKPTLCHTVKSTTNLHCVQIHNKSKWLSFILNLLQHRAVLRIDIHCCIQISYEFKNINDDIRYCSLTVFLNLLLSTNRFTVQISILSVTLLEIKVYLVLAAILLHYFRLSALSLSDFVLENASSETLYLINANYFASTQHVIISWHYQWAIANHISNISVARNVLIIAKIRVIR